MYSFKKTKKQNPAGSQNLRKPAPKKIKAKNIQNELGGFVNKSRPTDTIAAPAYQPEKNIQELPVHKQLLDNLNKRNFKNLTEIQDKCFDAIHNGRNLLGIAQTGTGKTAAYLTPLINQLINQKPGFQSIVIVPTRELALQVESEFKSLAAGLNLYSICLIGGTNVNKNITDLKRNYHVVIGTPGRLKDMKNVKALHFDRFQTLVLDEFDRLLDMGFLKDILHLVDAMSNRKQSILLSATEEASQKKVIDQLLDRPVEVRVSNGSTASDNIEQSTVKLKPGEDKLAVLTEMLKKKEFEKVLVFVETKHRVTKVWKKLNASGLRASQIHGNVSQNRRQEAIEDFKSGRSRILLATDIAARGLDINDVSHVINYEIPRTVDSYIHRIGRTGRAGKQGKALTLIGADEA